MTICNIEIHQFHFYIHFAIYTTSIRLGTNFTYIINHAQSHHCLSSFKSPDERCRFIFMAYLYCSHFSVRVPNSHPPWQHVKLLRFGFLVRPIGCIYGGLISATHPRVFDVETRHSAGFLSTLMLEACFWPQTFLPSE